LERTAAEARPPSAARPLRLVGADYMQPLEHCLAVRVVVAPRVPRPMLINPYEVVADDVAVTFTNDVRGDTGAVPFGASRT